MHDLARMAEARQAEAKQELEGLLAERSKLLEAASEAAQEPSQVAYRQIARLKLNPSSDPVHVPPRGDLSLHVHRSDWC